MKDSNDPDTQELFSPRQFDNAEAQKRFAENRVSSVVEYLEGQGIPPLFIAAALFEQHKRCNAKGLGQLTEADT